MNQKPVGPDYGPGPNSQELMKLRDENVARGISYVMPVFVKEAKGAIITDVDGREYIDFVSGIGVSNFGNNYPAVVEAIKNQADQYLHTCFMVTMYEPYVKLAEKLNKITPGEFQKKTAFFNSGAEAVENAVKLSRRYTKKTAMISLECAFHGRTLMTMTLTSKVKPYKYGFGPFATDVYKIPSAYCYRCRFGMTYPACDLHCARYLEQFFAVECAADNVAAVIAEPVQGEGGFIVPPKDYFKVLHEICRKNDVLLILDEIQSGFYRTGGAFASEHYGIAPDLITMAKSLAGGVPISALTGRAEVMDAAGPGEIGGTYGGNPIGCAAGLAVMEAIEKDDIAGQAKKTAELTATRLDEMAEKYSLIGEHRGLGAMRAIELVKDKASKEPAADAAKAIVKRCHERGLIIITAGIFGNVIRFLMPVNITEEQLNRGLDILEDAIAEEQGGK
ncbi:MAG: 4-aminobutyrate--2-oxoglutarate transaminase [Bacillota bacterium]|nr:4-aminobutyrate--2-oxoglutarate transaminase [Bacillota bacterium]MDW7728472.1 4-aminobutyrate--2-oxoglutarate transaminase [Bacillota bacterium]